MREPFPRKVIHVYMESTKFEMRYFNGPDDMHRTAMLSLGIGLIWHTQGDAKNDPEHYTESFDIVDSWHPEKNKTGLSRHECEEIIYDLYCDQM